MYKEQEDNAIDHVIVAIATALMIGATLLGFFNVVLRYAFGASLSWASTLINYMFIFSMFFIAAKGFKDNLHISVTVALTKLPVKIVKLVIMVATLITAAYIIIMLLSSYQLFTALLEFKEINIDLGTPTYIPYLVFGVSMIYALYSIFRRLYAIMYQIPADKLIYEDEEAVVNELGSTRKIRKMEAMREEVKKRGKRKITRVAEKPAEGDAQ